MRNEPLTRYFALAVGLVYLLVGVIGFIPALYTSPPASAPHVDATASYGYLFGLFPVNALHDVVHILIGLIGIGCAARFVAARAYAKGLFLIYGLLTILGTMPQADTVWGLIPIFSGDVVLHAATALAAGVVGWVVAEDDVAPEEAVSH
ncbi:MAG: DUF4383 domain-containing protein [Chloroflexi bacterium]|nr:DUF4383 domain-containing protein [Chloroflexota bacterium]